MANYVQNELTIECPSEEYQEQFKNCIKDICRKPELLEGEHELCWLDFSILLPPPPELESVLTVVKDFKVIDHQGDPNIEVKRTYIDKVEINPYALENYPTDITLGELADKTIAHANKLKEKKEIDAPWDSTKFASGWLKTVKTDSKYDNVFTMTIEQAVDYINEKVILRDTTDISEIRSNRMEVYSYISLIDNAYNYLTYATKQDLPYKSWSEWVSDHWGTRTVFDPIDVQVNANDDNILSIFFDTRWSPCSPWVEALIIKYPDLYFNYEYGEMGMAFGGRIESDGNGKFTFTDWDETKVREFCGCPLITMDEVKSSIKDIEDGIEALDKFDIDVYLYTHDNILNLMDEVEEAGLNEEINIDDWKSKMVEKSKLAPEPFQLGLELLTRLFVWYHPGYDTRKYIPKEDVLRIMALKDEILAQRGGITLWNRLACRLPYHQEIGKLDWIQKDKK